MKEVRKLLTTMSDQIKEHRNRKIVIVIIITGIALIHLLRVGQYLKAGLYKYYYSYASDIMIPFGFYFLLCAAESKIQSLRRWYSKALFVFCIASISETLQLYKIYALGITFDILDILMYAIGVTAAVLTDRLVLKKYIPFWDSSESANY
jgi:hypothetical protein